MKILKISSRNYWDTLGWSGNLGQYRFLTYSLYISAWFQLVWVPVTEEMAIGREGKPAWLSIKLCQIKTSMVINLAGEETLDMPEVWEVLIF